MRFRLSKKLSEKALFCKNPLTREWIEKAGIPYLIVTFAYVSFEFPSKSVTINPMI